jgi:hypothetical protein
MNQLAAICLLLLYAPTGQAVYVNAESVVMLRPPGSAGSTRHLTGQANCMINTGDGKFVAVKESCEEVRQRAAHCLPGVTPS